MPRAPRSVVHVPHASTLIPPDVRSQFVVDDGELTRQVREMTDWFTDELFLRPVDEATTIRFPVSRLIVDPERFEDDGDEPMAERGMGVVYTHGSRRERIRRDVDAEERRALLDRWYRPHHAALTSAVNRGLYLDEATGRKSPAFEATRRRLCDVLEALTRPA